MELSNIAIVKHVIVVKIIKLQGKICQKEPGSRRRKKGPAVTVF